MAYGKIVADQIQHSSEGTVGTQYVVNGSAKVWCAYDSHAQVIDGSLNASSLTDNATGDTTITFSSAFSATTEMCFTGMSSDDVTNNKHVMNISFARIGSTPYTTTTVRITTNFDGQVTTLQDADFAHTTGMGDLA